MAAPSNWPALSSLMAATPSALCVTEPTPGGRTPFLPDRPLQHPEGPQTGRIQQARGLVSPAASLEGFQVADGRPPTPGPPCRSDQVVDTVLDEPLGLGLLAVGGTDSVHLIGGHHTGDVLGAGLLEWRPPRLVLTEGPQPRLP